MNKKMVLLCFSLLVVSGLFLSRETLESSYIGKNILRSVSVLGISVVRNDSMKMDLVYESEGDGVNDQEIVLPTLSGKDVTVYIVRFFEDSGGYTGTGAYITPDGTDLLDGGTSSLYFGGMYYSRESIVLVADEENSSWWIVASY